MYDDILGTDTEKIEQTTEGLIEALKYNVKEKDKIIKKLIERVTELEIEIEKYN
jgi:hypothetical protein